MDQKKDGEMDDEYSCDALHAIIDEASVLTRDHDLFYAVVEQ
jgi:hypothetical protein